MRGIFWAVDLLLPVAMLVIGYYYYAKKSKQAVSKTGGLRTASTMKSRRAWEYAHRLCGRWLIVAGAVLAVYVVVVKLAAPVAAEWLSLLNNGVSILVFILVGTEASRRADRYGG